MPCLLRDTAIIDNLQVGCKIPWPFFSRKPPALTSIGRRISVINPEIASINVCEHPIFCDFPSFFMEIHTASPLKLAPTMWAFRHNSRLKQGQGIEHLIQGRLGHPKPQKLIEIKIRLSTWESRMGGFQEGGFQIVERAASSSCGNLLLQGALRLLLWRRVWGQIYYLKNPPSENPPIRFSRSTAGHGEVILLSWGAIFRRHSAKRPKPMKHKNAQSIWGAKNLCNPHSPTLEYTSLSLQRQSSQKIPGMFCGYLHHTNVLPLWAQKLSL